MRDTVRAEVVQISEGVARDLLGHSRLLWAVEREIHLRLPSILHQHALTLLPALARSAVTEAIPDVVGRATEKVREEVFTQYSSNVVKVVLPQGNEVELGSDAHAVLPELLVALHARCPVLLVGPPGTGSPRLPSKPPNRSAWTSKCSRSGRRRR